MARTQFKKIVLFSSLAVALLAHPACAKEKEPFVGYKEASVVLAPPKPAAAEPGVLQIEDFRVELAKGKSVLLFDARTKDEYDREHLPGARLPRPDGYYRDMELFRQNVVRESPNSKKALESATKAIPRGTPIVTYCHSHCGLSKSLKLDLEDLGFTNVRWLEGGIDDWREKGYPLEKR